MITRRTLFAPLLAGSGVALTILFPPPAFAVQPRGRAAAKAESAPLVMLDPGHGGKDPGAIGVSGTYEKHVALAAAAELKRQLQASGRYRAADLLAPA